MIIDKSKKSVLVGMSGGVDSSTVAAILKKDGYNVVGVTLQLYKQEEVVGKSKACCGSKDTYDAKKVSTDIGISHYVINYESEFKRDVVDNFVESYKNGITPIPCVRCNQSVKFRDMVKVAKDLGIDYVATGHYVRRIDGENGVEMHAALDKSKDQSYFLFATTRQQLEMALFPLGGYEKSQTRQLARDLGVSISEKRESQDICFIPDGDHVGFLKKIDPNFEKPGDIIRLETGKIVGKHSGAMFYTRGQRRGIGVGGSGVPLYVISTDIANNLVYIGGEDLLFESSLTIGDVNFISQAHENLQEFECNVVLRALQNEIPAIVTKSGDFYKISLKTPGRAITKGQACVMYDGTMVIGGGWII